MMCTVGPTSAISFVGLSRESLYCPHAEMAKFSYGYQTVSVVMRIPHAWYTCMYSKFSWGFCFKKKCGESVVLPMATVNVYVDVSCTLTTYW